MSACTRDRRRRSLARRAPGRGGARGAAGGQPRRGPRALLRLEHERLVVARAQPRRARAPRSRLEEAVEILEARAALESLAAGYAALRRTDAEVSELRGARRGDGESCSRPGSCWRCPSATRSCTAGSWRSPRHTVAQRHLRAAALAGRPLPVPHGARAGPAAEVAGRAPRDRRRDRRGGPQGGGNGDAAPSLQRRGDVAAGGFGPRRVAGTSPT